MSFGGVFGRTFSIWGRNFVAFTLMALVVYAPLILYTGIFLAGDLTERGIQIFTWVSLGDGVLLSFLLEGAITYGVLKQLRGEHASIGECLAGGFSRLLPVLGVGFLAGL